VFFDLFPFLDLRPGPVSMPHLYQDRTPRGSTCHLASEMVRFLTRNLCPFQILDSRSSDPAKTQNCDLPAAIIRYKYLYSGRVKVANFPEWGFFWIFLQSDPCMDIRGPAWVIMGLILRTHEIPALEYAPWPLLKVCTRFRLIP
jgi:hypothetical protein